MGRENREKIVVVKVVKKFNLIFFFEYTTHVGTVRRKLLLQLSEAQSTDLRRRRPAPEMVTRWRCGPPINHVTAHYNSQFCVIFIFVLSGKPSGASEST